MPTYEYRCPNGHEFEKFFPRISFAAAELECPECGKVAERLISGGAGLLFKGSGFYLTDYGRNAHRKSAPDKKESKESKKDSKSEGGSGGMKAADSGGSGASAAASKSTGSSQPKSGGSGGTSQ